MPSLRPDGTPYPYDARQAEIKARRGSALWKGAVMPTAAAFAPALAGLFTGGGAAAATSAGAGAVTAPAVGKLATLGKLFSSPGFSTAVNAGTTLLGMRSGNKAADQARTDQLSANREAIALERERLEMEARNANLDREDARALNDAINKLKQQELDLQIEGRDYERSLYNAREARLQPHRQASEAALAKLMSMWG